MTFKERALWCDTCKTHAKQLLWDTDPVPACRMCGGPQEGFYGQHARSATVIGDECDVWVEHGICNEDGSAKRYTSKSDMRHAARAKGVQLRVEHIPEPGSDKSKHTTRWV